MHILAAADIHGDHRIYRRLLEVAKRRKAEALILAGDLLGYAPGFDAAEDAQRADADVVLGLLEQFPIPVFYIMGNDDLVELGSLHDHIRSIHLRRAELGPFNLVGYQFSLPFMGGVNEKDEDSISRDLVGLSAVADTSTIFVTHSPAIGCLDTTMLGTHAGSRSISEFVEKAGVRAHIHGHIHGSFGRDGRHFNVAVLPKMKAMLIDVDALAHEVVDLGDGQVD
jgi:uncharacterized protein